MTVLSAARALSSQRIRVDFSGGIVDKNNALFDKRNFLLATATGVVPTIERIDVPGTDSPTFVEIVIPDMTNGASYTLQINPSPAISRVTSLGAVLSNDIVPFTGVGIAPKLRLASAQDSTSVKVQFDEAIYGTDVEDNNNYFFNLGLTVLGITDVGSDFVVLSTSAQTAGTVYALTFNGLARDSHNNILVVPANTPMLGYLAGLAVEEIPKLDMYKFIIEELRKMDKTGFLQRFLSGPQEVWNATLESIFALKKLISIETVPDFILPFQKRIQGWGREQDEVTNALSVDQLRALLFASPEFWRNRGPEDTTESVLRLLTGERMKMVNWFDLRTITDEMTTGVHQDRTDLFMLGSPDYDESYEAWRYEIRIVDSGSLDRNLVRSIARLSRPQNETAFIMYLGFLDTFEDDGDLEQWTIVAGSPTVSNRALRMTTTGVVEELAANPPPSPDWSSYQVSYLVEGTGTVYLQFYRTAATDYYAVKLVYSTQTISLVKVVANVETSLASIVITTLDEPLLASTKYTFYVLAYPEPGTTRLTVDWDGTPILSATDTSHAQGSIGIKHNTSSSAILHDVEMFFLPSEYDQILPNS